MLFPTTIWILLAVALVVSALGFKKYIWFISLGYGFSIAAEGIALLVVFPQDPLTGIACALFILYGCRLGGYLAFREFKSGSYAKHMQGEVKEDVPLGVKFAIWITCALLYVLQVLPMFYRLANGAPDNVWLAVGVIIMVCGVVLESAADWQKNRAKAVNPRRFVDTGLYRIVRCPNYLGEVVFWTGVVISGIGAVEGLQWLLVLLGYAGIVFVIFSGARRLEIRQNKNYGDDPEYQRYVKTVPILLPFVPLYSVEKYTWLVA
jgi:steroid 5-alpha reductase family enzyme